MLKWNCFFLLVWVVAWTAPPNSLEEAQGAIVSRFADIESLSATITNEEVQKRDAKELSVHVVREVEWKRSGDRFLYRAQVKATTNQKGNPAPLQQYTATTVSDGTHVVTVRDENGQATARRRKADISVMPDMKVMLDELKKDSTLTRFPDVKVGLDDCYAIQVVPKKSEGSDILQTMIYFRKDIGLDVRTVVYDKNNQTMFTSTTTNVKVNPKLHQDRFVLTIPDGVELVDETR